VRRSAEFFGLAVLASLTLPACSALTSDDASAKSVEGTVVTQQPIRVDSDPGAAPQSLPQPELTAGEWLEICKGNDVLITGSPGWYYSPLGEIVSLEGRQVTIADAENGIVGLPTLTLLSGDYATSGTAGCHWTFRLDNFQSDSEFFTVKVDGVPGTTNVTREDLLGGISLIVG
jgi:hypothetical protein